MGTLLHFDPAAQNRASLHHAQFQSLGLAERLLRMELRRRRRPPLGLRVAVFVLGLLIAWAEQRR